MSVPRPVIAPIFLNLVFLRTLKGYLLDVNLPLVVCYKTFFVLPTSYGDKWQNMKSLISQFSITNFDA